MANGFSKFSQDHHYASGIILVTVGVVGVVGSVTGELANMLAALWAPDILFTQGNQQADTGGGVTGAITSAASLANPATGAGAIISWLKGL